MRGPQGTKKGMDNLITGVVMLLVYLAVSLIAPEMSNRWRLLIALVGGIVASVVLYKIKQKREEEEEDEKLPPV